MPTYNIKLKDGRTFRVTTKEPGETDNVEPEQPGYLSRVGSSYMKEAQSMVGSVERGAELMQEGKYIQGAARSGLGVAGGLARATFAPVAEAVSPLIQSGIDKVSDNEFVQKFASSPKVSGFLDTVFGGVKKAEEWANKHPDAAANLKDSFDIATAVVGDKASEAVIKNVATKTKNAASTVIKPVKGAVTTAKQAAGKAGDLIDNTISEAGQIPSRMETNLAARTAKQTEIKSLPGKVAQKAAQDGIDILDIKDIQSIPKALHQSSKNLIDNVVKYARREVSNDPIEAVGKPIIDRLKELNTARGTIGQQLGEVAGTIGKVTSEEMVKPVLTRLRAVPGLAGLRIRKGVLYFKDTVIANTPSAQADIQNIFNNAIRAGSGKQKHLLRQELFESLGAAKKAGVQLTATTDKAYDAIRSGISDVLETKNATYKSLSNEFRKTIQPILKLNKILRTAPGDTVDALKMNAGLLARRLTSTSMSRIDVERVLRLMDNATKIKGNLAETTASLQKLYNILGKHYDLAPKTGYEGLTKSAMEGANSISGFVLDTAKRMAGETNAVRQKALEAFLKEVFK